MSAAEQAAAEIEPETIVAHEEKVVEEEKQLYGLPEKLWLEKLFGYLGAKDLGLLELTSPTFNNFIKRNPSVWQKLLVRTFEADLEGICSIFRRMFIIGLFTNIIQLYRSQLQ